MKKVLFVLVLLVSMAFMAEEGTAGFEQYNVNISPGIYETKTMANGSEIAFFNGTLIPAIIGPQTIPTSIILNGSSSFGMYVNITPDTFVFVPTTPPQNFMIKVIYPSGTLADTQDEITVGGNSTGTSVDTLQPTKVSVEIQKHPSFKVTTETPYVELFSAGDQVFFNAKIQNQGNCRDTYYVRVEDECYENLTREGWTINLGRPHVLVDKGGVEILAITGTTPAQKSGLFKIVLVFTSDTDTNFTETLDLYVRVKPTSMNPQTIAIVGGTGLVAVAVALLGIYAHRKRRRPRS